MNTDLLRSLFAIADLGSLSKAAEQLHVSQSTLTRQMQTLEHEIGGRLLERGHSGVTLTAAGRALLDGMKPILEKGDAVIAAARRLARGQSGTLRVGYVMSAAADYLNPALALLRKARPEIKVKLVDLSPGEQLAALRQGELDVVVLGNTNPSIGREFFVKRLASLPVVVALPDSHPLAENESLTLSELRRELFIGAHDADLPGYNQWMTQLCRRAGFRPRFLENSDSLSHALSTIVSENAVTLLPGVTAKSQTPGVAFRPLRQPAAKWDLLVAWQRGKITEPVRELVNALSQKTAAS